MKKFIIVLVALSWPGITRSTVTVKTFGSAVTTRAFDRASGTFYVGTAGSNNTIYAAPRPQASNIPSFSSVGAESNSIELMTLAAQSGTPAFAIPYTVENGSTQFSQNVLDIVSTNGTISNSSSALLDAAAATTNGIVGLAASSSYVFAAVSPNELYFGQANSGIAVVAINATTLALTQLATVNGNSTVQAAELDASVSSVYIGTANEVDLFPINETDNENNSVDIIWDNQLQRLYVPLLEQLTNSPAGAGARSVVMGRILDSSGHLELDAIAPDAAFQANYPYLIIGYRKGPGDVSTPFLSINKVRVMHCSTGPSYLIVNGDVNLNNSWTSSNFYAIPLVDLGSPTQAAQGTIADKTTALVNGKFTTAASSVSGMTLNTDIPALIGTGPLPITLPTPVADMQVIGDTVYVALSSTLSSSNETGILYSQAMFDATGKIQQWTPWTRRAFPINGIAGQTTVGPVSFFSVDAGIGAVWAIDGINQETTSYTVWSNPRSTTSVPNTSLVGMLNKTFQNSLCTSVLDLDQSTGGFSGSSTTQPYRYALFGGIGTIVFTITSQATSSSLLTPQTVTTDYSQSGYYATTTLPTSFPITVLEYSRRTDSSNYFFAGAQDGLYVFDNGTGSGFNPTALGLLTASPFTHEWVKISSSTILPGAIIDIKTTGLALYVITYQSTPSNPILNTVYRIPFQPTTQSMFVASNITTIAQSNTGVFAGTYIFSGMQIIMTAAGIEQLILATNRGVYSSTRAAGIQGAVSQSDAAWKAVDSNSSYFNGIARIDNGASPATPGNTNVILPTTVWPFAFQSPNTANIYNRSIWMQVSGTTGSTTFNYVPSLFNASNTSTFATLPLTTYFWSDGARRLAVVDPVTPSCNQISGVVAGQNKKPSCPEMEIFSLPYNVSEWNISSTTNQLLDNQVLNGYPYFYWIKNIGATGLLLVGTNAGVVGLQ